MDPDLMASKDKLNHLVTSKKTTTVAAAFDSDESDWSDEDDENTSVGKQAIAVDAISKDSSSSKKNILGDNLDLERQQQLLSSPYFIKESSAAGATTSENVEKKEQRDTAVFTKQEIQNEDDDWDEESCIVNERKSEQVFEKPVGNNNNAKFFQPSSASFTKHSKSDRNKPGMVDWSETFSDGGSEADNAEICNVENLPADNAHEETDRSKSNFNNNNKVQTEVIEDAAVVRQEHCKSAQNSPTVIGKAEEVPVILNKSPVTTSGESLDNLDSNGDCDFDNPSPRNTLPSSSSAAQLFRVAAPSAPSPLRPTTVESSKSTLDLSTSNPFLADTTNSKKKSKPSSAKHLFTRLFSADSEKSGMRKKDVPESSIRKTSEPIPLSTLLLNTPVTMHGSELESNLGESQVHRFHQTNPMIPSKYFPPDNAGREDNPSQSQTGESSGLNIDRGPKKRKGFIGKMKKTLGITSKGSKMKATESLKSLPLVATVPVASDPCISVQTEGRPPEEIIIDLLREGKRYLESTNHSQNGDGDNQAIGRRHDYDTDRLKRYSSEDVFTQLVGSSASAKSRSEISLVDDQEAPPESYNPRTHKDSKMSSYYCSQAVPNTPNRQVIYNLIEDFCCVLDKSFGEQDRLKTDNGNLFSEIDQLRAALECSEAGKRDLERQFQEMQDEIQKLQFCLEEECQARTNLEGIVCELKAQMERQDEILNCELAEKAELLATLKQLETDNWNLKNQLADFGVEREEFSKSFRGFEGTKNKCTELQLALVECCEKHDLMQKEILDLRNENNEIKLKLDNCVFEKNQEINSILKNEVFGLRTENNEIRMKLDNCEFEKNKLANEMEGMKQAFSSEKASLEAKICELLEGIAALEKAKADICKQTNTMLAAHHEEMDNLKANADNYQAKYDEERKIREDLEHRLRTTKAAEQPFRPSPSYNEMERSPPLSFPPATRTHSAYQRPTTHVQPLSLSPSATGNLGNRDTTKNKI